MQPSIYYFTQPANLRTSMGRNSYESRYGGGSSAHYKERALLREDLLVVHDPDLPQKQRIKSQPQAKR